MLRARYDGTAWTVLEADERGSTLELDSLASYGGAVWETGSHLGLVRFSDQLELRSYTPDGAAWYAPPVLGLELDCDDPELPMSVRIGDEPALLSIRAVESLLEASDGPDALSGCDLLGF